MKTQKLIILYFANTKKEDSAKITRFQIGLIKWLQTKKSKRNFHAYFKTWQPAINTHFLTADSFVNSELNDE